MQPWYGDPRVKTRSTSSALSEAMEKFPAIWTIYRRPRDYPWEEYCARVHYGDVPGPLVSSSDDLNELRRVLRGQGACVCLGRDENDDPVIVESWI